ncbi:acyl-CoA carboxylase subunit beta [Candidatus Poribacteria bacterium]|nr:acyl-CoA carboxylase subunit beta [Candidatus Poribacteria bacterium]
MTQPAQAAENRRRNLELVAELERALAGHARAGSDQAIARQHNKGKLTIPERFDLLFDDGASRTEIGAFAAMDMYEEAGGNITSAGVRAVIGTIEGRQVLVAANDSMVKAGAWFPMTIKKMLRAQQIAMENRLPTVYLVDSAGVYLPMQEEIFPDEHHAGKIFCNNSRMSALGIPQIAAIMGPCVAGGAYLPILSDEVLIVKGTGSVFLAGPFLVQAAIGEKVDAETLGGAKTHCEFSGICDYEEESEESCLARIRELVRMLPPNGGGNLTREDSVPPAHAADALLDHFPPTGAGYDMLEILECIADARSLVPYKDGYGQTLLCAYARVDGWACGIVANQRKLVRSAGGEMQIGGVVYSDCADKAARFILNCNQKGLPILFFHDVTGFMVGTRAEKGGIIKDGAKMVNAVSNSRVPLISFVVGSSSGAGNYAMCGRAYGPRFMVAWPTARIAVMGGDQASKTLLALEKQKRQDNPMSAAEETEFLDKVRAHYESTANAYHAASRLWVDAVIDPRQTREVASRLLTVCDLAPLSAEFKTGVFQT